MLWTSETDLYACLEKGCITFYLFSFTIILFSRFPGLLTFFEPISSGANLKAVFYSNLKAHKFHINRKFVFNKRECEITRQIYKFAFTSMRTRQYKQSAYGKLKFAE